jgi:protein gp37
MSDIGHARVPAAFTARMFAVMALAPQHIFQLLTFSERPRATIALACLFAWRTCSRR